MAYSWEAQRTSVSVLDWVLWGGREGSSRLDAQSFFVSKAGLKSALPTVHRG
jgi:hypothetical protein